MDILDLIQKQKRIDMGMFDSDDGYSLDAFNEIQNLTKIINHLKEECELAKQLIESSSATIEGDLKPNETGDYIEWTGTFRYYTKGMTEYNKIRSNNEKRKYHNK